MRPKPQPTPLPPGPVCGHNRTYPCPTCERGHTITKVFVGFFVLYGVVVIGAVLVCLWMVVR